MKRRITRQIKLGNVGIGSDYPISIQSMTNTPTSNIEKTLEQINKLHLVGCEIIRVTFPSLNDKDAFCTICEQSPIPVIADVHFDANIAKAALRTSAAAIRINPGNITNEQAVQEIARIAAGENKVVRIGVNSGSLSARVREKFRGNLVDALVESALEYCDMFEKNGCSQIKVSLKSSNVPTTVEAYQKFACLTDYPLHIGVTEAGTLNNGIIKSSTAMGALLLAGIGDTMRISLTADPVEEIKTGIKILQSVGLRQAQPEIICCPTCGRTNIELIPLVEAVENEIQRLNNLGFVINMKKLAIMGCVVNGPGEAKDADFGIAGGNGTGVVFRNGEIIEKVNESDLLNIIFQELKNNATK